MPSEDHRGALRQGGLVATSPALFFSANYYALGLDPGVFNRRTPHQRSLLPRHSHTVAVSAVTIMRNTRHDVTKPNHPLRRSNSRRTTNEKMLFAPDTHSVMFPRRLTGAKPSLPSQKRPPEVSDQSSQAAQVETATTKHTELIVLPNPPGLNVSSSSDMRATLHSTPFRAGAQFQGVNRGSSRSPFDTP